MSYPEKNNIVSLISTLVIFGFYFFNVYQIYQAGVPNTVAMIATMGLWVPVIILTIIVHVVFNVINAIATNQNDVPPADERDKLIELKATRNAHYLFIVGFFIAMAFLTFSTAPFVIFNLLIFAFIASELLGYASQLYYYRRGF